jgi:hypothetical protein
MRYQMRYNCNNERRGTMSKVVSMEDAVKHIKSGSTITIKRVYGNVS